MTSFQKVSILAVAMLIALVGSLALSDSADACGYGGYSYTSHYAAPTYVAAPVYKVRTYHVAPTYYRASYVVPSYYHY